MSRSGKGSSMDHCEASCGGRAHARRARAKGRADGAGMSPRFSTPNSTMVLRSAAQSEPLDRVGVVRSIAARPAPVARLLAQAARCAGRTQGEPHCTRAAQGARRSPPSVRPAQRAARAQSRADGAGSAATNPKTLKRSKDSDCAALVKTIEEYGVGAIRAALGASRALRSPHAGRAALRPRDHEPVGRAKVVPSSPSASPRRRRRPQTARPLARTAEVPLTLEAPRAVRTHTSPDAEGTADSPVRPAYPPAPRDTPEDTF